jgi:hypothetical protein
MRVVCIDSGSYHLTVGKIYDVSLIKSKIFDYTISNDKGCNHYVESNLFIPLTEVRNKKLESIGI